MNRSCGIAVWVWVVCAACVGAADESASPALESAVDVTSCETYAAALADGSVEPDIEGDVVGDAIDEWSEVIALWTSLQTPGDVDTWTFPLTDLPAFSLDPWVRIQQTDMIGHAWPEVCVRYEGPGEAACFIGSTPSEDGCCKSVDEYGSATVHLSLDDVWRDDGGLLHVSLRAPGDSCGGTWLLVAGARPDDA